MLKTVKFPYKLNWVCVIGWVTLSAYCVTSVAVRVCGATATGLTAARGGGAPVTLGTQGAGQALVVGSARTLPSQEVAHSGPRAINRARAF